MRWMAVMSIVERTLKKLTILMQITIYCATSCLFQHTNRKSHHYNYLKVGEIAVTPQTRNPHARPSVGQPFDRMT